MKMWQFWLLVAFIYVSQVAVPWSQIVFGAFAMIMAALALKEES